MPLIPEDLRDFKVSLKHWNTCTKLHASKSQRAVMFCLGISFGELFAAAVQRDSESSGLPFSFPPTFSVWCSHLLAVQWSLSAVGY